jgi:hypothetical protein
MSTTATPLGAQFLRFGQLVVSKGSQGLDLSALRFRFEVKASDNETPNTLIVRVYNLAQNTVNTILPSLTLTNGIATLVQKFNTVTLTAGYVNGNKGNIFQGDIKQFYFGRERNVDSFLEIRAGDGDQAYNQSVINQTFPAGTSDAHTLSALAASMGLTSAKTNDGYVSTGGILPRGKTLFGMARIHMRELAHSNDCRWSIQNGVVTLVPNTGYLPGTVVQINSATGMIGTPEQTDNGIVVRCLLNPNIKIGQMVQINNTDINQVKFSTSNPGQFGLAYQSQYYPATTSDDGYYRVMVAEHSGDTRGQGNDWYTELTCLDISKSSKPATSVLPAG